MGMPPVRRPDLHLSTSKQSNERAAFSNSRAFTKRPVPASDTSLNMATELRMPSPVTFSPSVPSPRIQLPPIFPCPPTTITYAQAAPQRPDYPQQHIVSPGYGSPYTQPPPQSFGPGPPLRIDLPPTQSPAGSRSSYSPSLVASASSPRNFEPTLSRKRSYDQALSDYDRHVWLIIFQH